jgi:hypothetical protein
LKRVQVDIADMKGRLKQLKRKLQLARRMHGATRTIGQKTIENIQKIIMKSRTQKQKINYARKRALK